MKKLVFFPIFFLLFSVFAQPDWYVNSSDFQYSMTLIAILKAESDTLDNENDQIAAFFNNEIRGVASPTIFIESLGKKVAFLTVYSNQVSTEQMAFKLYGSAEDSIYEALTTIAFEDGSQQGNNSNPILFTESNKVNQSISFEEIGNKTFGDTSFPLSAVASSDLEVSFSVISGPIAINGNEVTITGAGEATISASQLGNEQYNAAGSVTQSFAIEKAEQVISFYPEEIGDKSINDNSFGIMVLSDSGQEITISIDGPASIVDLGQGEFEVTLDGIAGTVTLDASTAESVNYLPAFTSLTFEVNNLLSQSITFEEIGNKTFGDTSFPLSAVTSSDLEVSFSVISGPIAINGNEVTITGVGEATILASQLGNEQFNAAESVNQSFIIEKAEQVISFTISSNFTIEDNPIKLLGSSSSGLALVYSSSNSAVASITEEDFLVFNSVGIATIEVLQEGNDNYYPTSVIRDIIVVNVLNVISDYEVKVYPNPTTHYISINGIEEDIPFSLFNVDGKLVKKGIVKDMIDVSDLEIGVYFLKAKLSTLRIIKVSP